MRKFAAAKLNDERGGVARILVILSVGILIMIGIILIPTWKAFRYKSQCIACQQAIKTATDGLRIEFIETYDEDNVDEARKTLARIMPEREDICPTHGNVYLIKGEDGILVPVCGLHSQDIPRRTRLNAQYAADMLEEARKDMIENELNAAAAEDSEAASENTDSGAGAASDSGAKAETAADADSDSNKETSAGTDSSTSDGSAFTEPEAITIKTNNKALKCTYVTEEVGIRRGTSTTDGYKGIVAFYGLNDEGEINYFVYADEDYCAIWHEGDGWSGSAYDE